MAQPLQQGRKEVGTTLPAPLKPEHGWRENQGEKRQQLGAEPASSQGERLEKDRACIVPWGSALPCSPSHSAHTSAITQDGLLQAGL